MQLLLLWALLLVCACGWMIDAEIDFSFIFFSFMHLHLGYKMLIIKAMHERFRLNRFLLGTQEEKRLARYLKKKGIPETWLAEEMETMSAKCLENRK